MKGRGNGPPLPREAAPSAKPRSYAEQVAARVPVNSLDIDGLADYIRSGKCKSILALTGAGISTGAGIPDWRSAGGFYDTLMPQILTATEEQCARIAADPQFVVSRSLFMTNPCPMLEVKRAFVLGVQECKWRATPAHWFFQFLADDGLLLKHFTSNVDALDLQTGFPSSKLVAVHGSMKKARCENRDCKSEMDFDRFCEQLKNNIKDLTGEDTSAPASSVPIVCPECGQPTVKPDVVLFEGDMPSHFDDAIREVFPPGGACTADLLIVAGTSLKVPPVNSLVKQFGQARPSHPRVVVDKFRVGEELGVQYGDASVRDMFLEGECDSVFLQLMIKLGWRDRLNAIRNMLPSPSQSMLDTLLASCDTLFIRR